MAEPAGPSFLALENNWVNITKGRKKEKDSLALDLITLVTSAIQNIPL